MGNITVTDCVVDVCVLLSLFAWPWEEKQRKAEKYLPCHVAHCHLDLAVMGEGVSEADLLIYQLWNVLTRKQVKTHPSGWSVGSLQFK